MRPKLSAISQDEMLDVIAEIKITIDFIKSNPDIISDKELIQNINIEKPLENDAEKMLIAIHELISGFKSGNIETEADHSDLGLCLGHSASVFAANYLSWELKFLACDYWPKGEVAVISKDKKYVLYLAIHTFMSLSNDEVENKFIDKINAFKSRELPLTKSKFSVIM